MNAPAPPEIEAFLVAEARLLDERRWDEWLALFDDEAWYWVPIEEGQPDPRRTVSLIYDDRQLLETRIRRLAGAQPHAQTPQSRTSRIVANATIEKEEAGTVTIRSKFQMIEFRRDAQRLFGGTQWHGLKHGGNAGFVIAWKKVELVNCDGVLDGINIPF